jgi:hypothetical protein
MSEFILDKLALACQQAAFQPMTPAQEVERATYTGETNDCAVLALSNACDVAYHRAHDFLAKAGRKPRRGVRVHEIITRKRGVILGHKFTLVRRSGSLARFLRDFPAGRFVITVRRHCFAVVDGLVHDYSRQAPGRHICRAWRVQSLDLVIGEAWAAREAGSLTQARERTNAALAQA